MRNGRRRSRCGPHVVTAVVLLLALPLLSSRPASATVYPPLVQPGSAFLTNLSAPSVTSGGSSSISFVVANPLAFPITGTVVTLALYAFNGFPGDAVRGLPVGDAPTLGNGSSSGPTVNVSLGAIASGASVGGSVRCQSSAASPAGAYAVRVALSFHGNGSDYRLLSRGWFTASLWANATRGPNGTASLNLTMLNVSGVVPETAVFLRVGTWPVVLDLLLGVGVALVGAGAYVYFRRSGASRSGAG